MDADNEEHFSLLGIVSREPDYKLSLSLNKRLKISLKNASPVEVKDGKGVCRHFSKYSDNNVAPGINFNLISNRSDNEVLLKKLNKIDYFLQVHSAENEFDVGILTGSIRTIDCITALFVLDPGEIKDKNLQYLIP